MGKKRLRLKTERIDGEEVVRMECVSCHGTEDADADMVFECWEMDGGPFPVSECPFCSRGMRIPEQVIDETEETEEKEKHLGRPKSKS